MLHPPFRLPDETSWCTELKVTETITTPVNPSELSKALSSTFYSSKEVVEIPIEKELKTLPHLDPLNILLVEDSLVNQKLAVALLKKFGHSVTLAKNGIEAVEQALKAKFDVILMDIQMPEMDGFEATTRIRQSETEKQTPIIALTAHAMKGYKERCLEAGMDGYVTKPLRIEELFEAIFYVINLA